MSSMEMKRKLQAIADQAAFVANAIAYHKGHIKVVSHFDADGICAAAIMYKTLTYLGKDFEISFLKLLGREEIAELARESNSMVIFLDMGSGQTDLIRDYMSGIPIVVVDHHPPGECKWNLLFELNPHIAGIDGSKEISGAGMTYILSRSLSNRTRELLYLAIVGAAGDMQIEKGKFFGVNGMLLEDAIYAGIIKSEKGLKIFGRYTKPIHKALEYLHEPYIENVSGNESGAVQLLNELGIPVTDEKGNFRKLSDLSKEEEKKLATVLAVESVNGGGSADDVVGEMYKIKNNYEVAEFASVLNACGRLEKPFVGLEICLGDNSKIDSILKEYKIRIGSATKWAKNHKDKFIVTDNAMYVIAKNNIGDNIIGIIVSILLKTNNGTNIIFGFANAIDGVKVSSRARKSNKIDLGEVIRKAVIGIEGESIGGGHTSAAGAKIPFGSEMKFIEMVEKELTQAKSNETGLFID